MELKAIVRKVKKTVNNKTYYYGRIQIDSSRLEKMIGKVVVLNIPD